VHTQGKVGSAETSESTVWSKTLFIGRTYVHVKNIEMTMRKLRTPFVSGEFTDIAFEIS
jgi:hypothetical protein